MSEEDIADTNAAFAKAAVDSKKLGFDTVKIHATHGYLIDQFFWDSTNQHTDQFNGASIKERSRFAAEGLHWLGPAPAWRRPWRNSESAAGFPAAIGEHLGHYLLLRLLSPSLARNAIVVLTTSNTHDPMFSPVAPFPFVDARQLAYCDLEKGSKAVLLSSRDFAPMRLRSCAIC